MRDFRDRMNRESSGSGGGWPIKAIVIWALIIVAAIILLANVTWKQTDNKEFAVHYTGGPIEGTEFVGTIPSGQPLRPIGLADKVYPLPANQRTYIATQGGGGDGPALTATNADGNLIEFDTSMTFEVNQQPDVADDFYSGICTKYNNCADDASWNQVLDDYLRKAQETLLQSVSRSMSSEKMTQNPDALAEIGTKVREGLPEQINKTMGGPYFEVSEFQVNNLHPPESVTKKYEQLTASKVSASIATQEANKAENLQKTLQGNPQYLGYLDRQNQADCIESKDCQVIYVPQDSIVQVPAPEASP